MSCASMMRCARSWNSKAAMRRPAFVPDVTGMMLMGEVHCVTHSPCVFGAEKKYSENPRWNFP